MSFITWIKSLFSWKQKAPKYNLLIVRSKSKPAYETNGSKTKIKLDKKITIECDCDLSANEDGFRLLTVVPPPDTPDIIGKGDLWFVRTTSASQRKEFTQGYAFPKKTHKWYWMNNPELVNEVLNADISDAAPHVGDKKKDDNQTAPDPKNTVSVIPPNWEGSDSAKSEQKEHAEDNVKADVKAEDKTDDLLATEDKSEVIAEEKVEDTPVAENKSDAKADEKVEDTPVAENKSEVKAEKKVEDTPVAENKSDAKAEEKVEDTPATEGNSEVKPADKKDEAGDEGTAGIDTIGINSDDAPRYDINGSRVDPSHRGIVIEKECNPTSKTEGTDVTKEIEELRDQLTEIKGQNKNLLAEILKILKMNGNEQLPPKEILKKLREHINALQKEADKALEAAIAREDLQGRFDALVTEKNNADQKCEHLKNAMKQAETTAENAKNILIENHKKEITAVKTDLQNVKDEKASLETKVSELESTDAGQLKAGLEEAQKNIASLTTERDQAIEESKSKDQIITEKDGQISSLKEANNDLSNKLSEKTAEAATLSQKLGVANTTINNHELTIGKLKQDKDQLKSDLDATQATLSDTESRLGEANKKISGLETTVNGQDLKINKLNDDISVLKSDKKALANTVAQDVATLLNSYAAAADSLKAAVAENFIYECNPDKDSETVKSMCTKIRLGVNNVADEISGLKSKALSSAKEVEDAFCKIIADNIEGKAFTEIARWWAYSRLPFMANKDREEGRAVDLTSINAAYGALCRLIAMAGYNYQIPALFVENLEDGEYKDRTGEEQLNLEYQFPNVRLHAENIDRADRDFTILDISSLGYYRDGKLVKNTAIIR